MFRKLRKITLPLFDGTLKGELGIIVPDDGKGGPDADALDRHVRALGKFDTEEIVEIASSRGGWRTLGRVTIATPGGRELDPWDLAEDAGTAPEASLGPLTDQQYEIFLRGGDPERKR